jgi:outer membrane protein OmpA-like peptidoglycan-associated protein
MNQQPMNLSRTGIFILYLMLLSVWSCASAPSLKKTEDMVIKAEDSFRITQGAAKGQKEHQDALKKSEAYLMKAGKHWKARRSRWAYKNAVESFLISKGILRQVYVAEIVPLAEKNLSLIENKVAADPENPLKFYIPKLQEIINLKKPVQEGVEFPGIHLMVEDAGTTVIDSGLGYETQQDEEIDSDVTFAFGKYKLSSKGMDLIQKLTTEDIMPARNRYAEHNQGKAPNTYIHINGYTDEAGFIERGPLFRELKEDVNNLPEQLEERRKYLNQRLSMFRARDIKRHIEKTYIGTEGADALDHVIITISGRGEAYPYPPEHVYPSYQRKDQRRRICKIYFSLKYGDTPPVQEQDPLKQVSY